MTYYIIGTTKPKGATHESEITHYRMAQSLEDAKDNKGKIWAREALVSYIKPGDEIRAYNPKNGATWLLSITT